jgi:hypothetical protein
MRRAPVERRAGRRCEYCRAPQDVCAYTFHVEHIVPRSKGGADAPSNAALSCWSCNSAKSDHLTGTDPQTGREEPLFNPRLHRWEEHFSLSADLLRIEGCTALGRATVSRLRLNDERFQPHARRLWLQAECWP